MWLSHTRNCKRWVKDFLWCFQNHLLQEKKFELSFIKRRNMIELMLKLWLQQKQLSEMLSNKMLSKKINKRRTMRLLSKEINKRRTVRLRTVKLQSHYHWILSHSLLHSSSLWCSSLKIDRKMIKISHWLLLLLLLSMNLHFLSSYLWWLEQLNLIVQWRKQLYESRSFNLDVVFMILRWR